MSTQPAEESRNFGALQTHAVDRVASMLLALVIVIGLAVVVMGAVYLSRLEFSSPESIVLLPDDEQAAGRGDHAAGFARDFAPPGQEEVDQLNEPTLEQSLEAVTDAVSNIAASLNTVESASAEASQGSGMGDSRPPGPLGEGANIISRAQRWQLKFTARNVKTYAGLLDFFKIELGAIGGGNDVDYAYELSGSPKKRTAPGDAEKRLYILWREAGPLKTFDEQLMRSAGIDTRGREIVKFINPELETKLAVLEKEFAFKQHKRNVHAKEFARTIFECQPDASGFQWVVLEQRLRTVGSTK